MRFRTVCGLLGAMAFCLAVFVDARAATLIEKSSTSIVAARENLLAEEFEKKGLKLGSPVFLRVYKQSSTMEMWVAKGPRYALFKTFRICRWSGGLGPKMFEGDRQSPEGLYHITSEDLIVNPRWHRAMNINYPNRFDVINGRGGSGILIHGKCGSVGCFAIQDNNVEEVYDAVRAALHKGQVSIPVLALPFSFAKYAPAVEDTLKLNEFWSDLRRADISSTATASLRWHGFAMAVITSGTGVETAIVMLFTCPAASPSISPSRSKKRQAFRKRANPSLPQPRRETSGWSPAQAKLASP